MNECITHLRSLDRCGYAADGPWSAEPTALASLALKHFGEHAAAERFATQLAEKQLANGAVPATSDQDSPAWTTSLAILAWLASDQFNDAVERAIDWAFAHHGKPAPRSPHVGHDTALLGWSWAAETHSWMEPTAMFVVALKAAGLDSHPRVREGVTVVIDRLLADGGSNFGNTFVLGQATLPQVESTGLAMLALADEKSHDPRIEKSLNYLSASIDARTTTASLCYGLWGLTAHGRRPANAETLLSKAFDREIARGPSAFKLALIALASVHDMSWIVRREVLLPV